MKGLEDNKAEHIFADPPYTQASAESDQEGRLCSLKDEIISFAISAESKGQFCLQDHDHAFWKALWFWCASFSVEVSVLLSETSLNVKAVGSRMKGSRAFSVSWPSLSDDDSKFVGVMSTHAPKRFLFRRIVVIELFFVLYIMVRMSIDLWRFFCTVLR